MPADCPHCGERVSFLDADTLITSAEIAAITGYGVDVVHTWTKRGVLRPAVEGGPGKPHLFRLGAFVNSIYHLGRTRRRKSSQP